jgi:hypothetical protein
MLRAILRAAAVILAGSAVSVSAADKTPIPKGVSIETSEGRVLLTVHTEIAPNRNGEVSALRNAPVVKDVLRYYVNQPDWHPAAVRFAVGERTYTDVRPDMVLAVLKTSPRGMFITEVRSADFNPKWYARQYQKMARHREEPAFLIIRIASALGLNPREYPVRLDPALLDAAPSPN